MALSAADKRKAAVWLCGTLFRDSPAIYDLDDAVAAVTAIDNALDATFQQAVNAGYGASTVVSGLGNQLPAPFSLASAGTKFLVGVAVFMARGGLLD